MAVKTVKRRLPDTYFELVRRFPLIHVHDEKHLKEAQTVIDGLLQENLDEGGEAYLDALTDLVEVYEDEHEKFADASEADVFRVMMAANRLNQTELSKATKIAQSTISAVLNGSRSLTRGQVERLAKFFHVSPAVFFPS